jgi:PAS domain S-box-containing protein
VTRVVAATLVTVTTVLLGTLGTLDSIAERNTAWERLQRVTRAQADEIAVALALPVWNIDHAQIDKILDSQSDAAWVEGVIVHASGKTYARVRDAQRRFVAPRGAFPTAGLLSAKRAITFYGERIGTVQLFTTRQFIERDLRNSLLDTVIAVVAIDLILILSVYWILWRAVLGPLVGIERYAGVVSMQGSASSVQPASTKELESLRVSIETMVGLLDRRYGELQAETARRSESEERFRTIFESVNDAILIIDAETGEILDVNARMSEMFGYTREEALALDLVALSSGVGPYTQAGALQRIREAREGNGQIFEWRARFRGGSLFWAEVSMREAMIEGKSRVLVVVRDVDRRKEMEKAVRRSETMSAMGAIVAGVAHEVRNPLFGMSALLDAYAEELKGAELTELSTGLREQVTRLTHLMRELLEFGRPVKVAREPGALRSLIDEVLRTRAAAASRAEVTLQCTIDPNLPEIAMDHERLSQVFENVLDNALQHAPPVRTITIAATETVIDGHPWIECTIEDDGDGFQPGDLSRIFEPFFTRRERGVGLGMSIVQRIVEEHSGRVIAGNRAGGGAVVTVSLPAIEVEVEA